MTADLKAAHVAKEWTHNPAALLACRIDPAGEYAFATAEDRNILRWNLATGALASFKGHDSWAFALAFLDGGKTLVSAGGDGRLIWWPARDPQPKPMRTVDAHQGWARCVASSLDGKLLASGGNDFRVKVWSSDGVLRREIAGHDTRVYSVLFHPDGKSLYTGDLHGAAYQWDLAGGKKTATFDAKQLFKYEAGQGVDFGGVRSMSLSPDRKRLVCAGLHNASNPLGAVHEPLALSFDATTGKQLKAHVAPGVVGTLWRTGFLPDGTLFGVVGGTSGGFLVFWKLDQDKDVHRVQLPALARDGCVLPDGVQILTSHSDRKLRLTKLAKKA